jgi:hypothetical protein
VTISASKKSTYAKDDNEQEIDISDIVKLKPQVLWDKAQWGILCGANLVAPKMLFDVPILVSSILWNRHIDVHCPGLQLSARFWI